MRIPIEDGSDLLESDELQFVGWRSDTRRGRLFYIMLGILRWPFLKALLERKGILQWRRVSRARIECSTTPGIHVDAESETKDNKPWRIPLEITFPGSHMLLVVS